MAMVFEHLEPANVTPRWRKFTLPGRLLLRNAMFHQEHVPPDAVQLTEAFPVADNSETTGLVEGNAGGILGEDTGLHGPVPRRARRLNESEEYERADPLPMVAGVDIHAVLDHARIATSF